MKLGNALASHELDPSGKHDFRAKVYGGKNAVHCLRDFGFVL